MILGLERWAIPVPLVFVHGIANRPGPDQQAGRRLRERLFRQLVLATVGRDGGRPQAVVQPFWGDRAGRLGWQGRSFPLASLPPLGGGEDDTELVAAAAGSLPEPSAPERLLADLARKDFADAVDLLFTLSLDDGASLPVDDLAELAGRLVALGGADGPPPEWVTATTDDLHLLALMETEVARLAPAPTRPAEQPRPMGAGADGWAALRRGVRRLRRAAGNVLHAPWSRGLRRLSAGAVPLLLGDVTAYLSQRGTARQPGPIVAAVLSGLEAGTADRAAGRPLVAVGHSMGGNILYDILSHFRPELEVDLFVTVGSQVGLFEELKLFGASRPDIPGPGGERVARPAGVGRWVNVVDRNDPLAFRVEPIFEGAEDYLYPSGALWAHTAYLKQPHFYYRLGRRLAEVTP